MKKQKKITIPAIKTTRNPKIPKPVRTALHEMVRTYAQEHPGFHLIINASVVPDTEGLAA